MLERCGGELTICTKDFTFAIVENLLMGNNILFFTDIVYGVTKVTPLIYPSPIFWPKNISIFRYFTTIADSPGNANINGFPRTFSGKLAAFTGKKKRPDMRIRLYLQKVSYTLY